jgi:uncharacterized protein (DUF3084 family)
MDPQEDRLAALDNYRKKLRELRELEARLKSNRASVADLVAEYNKTEEDLRALQVRRLVRQNPFDPGCAWFASP